MQEVLFDHLRKLHDASVEHHGEPVGLAYEAGCLAGMLSGVFEDFLTEPQQQAVINAVRNATDKIGIDGPTH